MTSAPSAAAQCTWHLASRKPSDPVRRYGQRLSKKLSAAATWPAPRKSRQPFFFLCSGTSRSYHHAGTEGSSRDGGPGRLMQTATDGGAAPRPADSPPGISTQRKCGGRRQHQRGRSWRARWRSPRLFPRSVQDDLWKGGGCFTRALRTLIQHSVAFRRPDLVRPFGSFTT